MKTKGLLLLLAFALLIPVASTAQVGNLLKNKMNKVVNAGVKTVNKEIDAEIDTAVNNEAEKAKERGEARTEQNKKDNNQPSSDEAGGQAGGGMMGLFSNEITLKYKESYDFTSRMYMVSESYDKKDVLKMDMYIFYSANHPSMGMETKSLSDADGETIPILATMLLDGENRSFLALTDMNGMKMGMISSVEEEYQPTDKKGRKDTPPVFTKTGNTREIAGYKCDEYSYVDPDDDSKGKVWYTKDPGLKIDRRGWQNTGMSTYYASPQFNDGLILASEAYDSKGNLTMKSETKEINENFPHTISVKGYTLRQMKSREEKK